MYQGRFSQKDAAATPKPQQTPEPKAAPLSSTQSLPKLAPAKKRKPQASLGTTIFYTLYFLFIVLFCAGVVLGLGWLRGWLEDYEASQPGVKAQQVFVQLFQDPQWEDLYTSAGIEDSIYENAESFTAYMEERMAGQALTYSEAAGGPSGNKKYHVRLGDEAVAAFTLEDCNKSPEPTALPNWQLQDVELFFDRDLSYRIVKLDGYTAQVNGVTLQDKDILQIATTIAEGYLPSGVEAPRMCTQAVDGLFRVPEVKIFNKEGTEQAVTYDESTRTFTQGTMAEQIPEDLQKAVLDASQYHALWIQAAVNDQTVLKTHFLEGTDTYAAILRAAADPVQEERTWEFTDTAFSDYCRYDENHFSVRVEITLAQTQDGSSAKNWPYGQSMIFQKQSSGSWLCILAVDFPLSEPVGRVRLTFMRDDTPVSSEFYHTDARELITPILNAPEGQAFAGWVRRIQNENGETAQELVFRPDSTGRVAIPEGQYLTPMTLYAHFEPIGGNE